MGISGPKKVEERIMSNDQFNVDEIGRARSMLERKNAYRILVIKPEGNRPLR
jgi:hypothetical protein